MLEGGPFHRAAGALLATGFVLPWFDLQPVPTGNYSHAFYTEDHRIAQIEPDPASLPLYIPLGSSIHPMPEADTDSPVSPGHAPHAGETPATGEGDDRGEWAG